MLRRKRLLLHNRDADDDTVHLRWRYVVVDQHRKVVSKGVPQQIKHPIARGPVVIVAQLKTEAPAGLRIELDYHLHVQEIAGRPETGAYVMHSQEGALLHGEQRYDP
jgi:hypothetical protein